MQSDSYIELEPRAELRPWVRRVWRYQDDDPSDVVQRIPPDGCPELIVHLGEPYEEERASGRYERQPRILFAGQMTTPLCLRATGALICVGIRFEPDGAAGWFGRSMHEATNLRLDVTSRLPPIEARSIAAEDCLDLLQRQVAAAMNHGRWQLERSVRADVRNMEEGRAAGIRTLAQRRRRQRLFLRLVGVPRQTLQSIFRFRKVFDRAGELDGGSWLRAALEAGYFDQPQMARDFRRFLGCTATEWAREQVELARFIAMSTTSQSYKNASDDGR